MCLYNDSSRLFHSQAPPSNTKEEPGNEAIDNTYTVNVAGT